MGAANQSNLREVDIDVDEPDMGGRRDRHAWSIASFGLPLPMVAVLLVSYGAAVLWIDSRLAPIPIIVEQNKEIRAEQYKQGDAVRDLALRDDRIAEMGRRIELLERLSRGGR